MGLAWYVWSYFIPTLGARDYPSDTHTVLGNQEYDARDKRLQAKMRRLDEFKALDSYELQVEKVIVF